MVPDRLAATLSYSGGDGIALEVSLGPVDCVTVASRLLRARRRSIPRCPTEWSTDSLSVADAVMRNSPKVCLLVTSRQLPVAGEQDYRVPSMTPPGMSATFSKRDMVVLVAHEK